MNNNNKEIVDSLSKLVGIALDMLFLKNPTRSSLGVLLGVLCNTFTQIFAPFLKEIQIVDLSTIAWWQYIVLGLGLMYLPLMVRYLFRVGGLGEDVEIALAIIRKAEHSGLPKTAVRQLYLELGQT